jgi:parallel beta-helix repeat protein
VRYLCQRRLLSELRCASIAAQNGTQINRRANATVSANTIVENRYDPAIASSGGILLFEAGDDVTVNANTADRNDVGIWVIGTSNAAVLSNKVKNSTFDGIAIQHGGGNPTAFNTVSKNTATLNGNSIGLYDTASNVIDHNTLSTSEGSGVFVDATSTGNFLQTNKSKQNFTFGMEDESVGAGRPAPPILTVATRAPATGPPSPTPPATARLPSNLKQRPCPRAKRGGHGLVF